MKGVILMNLTGLKGNANSDKLFYALLMEIKNRGIDVGREFTILELAELIPIGTAEICNPSTYGYSFTSMLSNQKDRDYIILLKQSVQDALTLSANNPQRNNYYWKSHYANEKLIINPKYFLL
jgi:5-methylcytosine-specific restriction protein A